MWFTGVQHWLIALPYFIISRVKRRLHSSGCHSKPHRNRHASWPQSKDQVWHFSDFSVPSSHNYIFVSNLRVSLYYVPVIYRPGKHCLLGKFHFLRRHRDHLSCESQSGAPWILWIDYIFSVHGEKCSCNSWVYLLKGFGEISTAPHI